MPRIFNAIRQRLLKENRLTRYLVYAVGEIVLVVIGILIALQINDSSAQRKLERTNVRLMERMKDELVINIDRLHYLDTMYSFKGVRLGWTPMLGRIDTAIGYIKEGLDEERLVWMLEADKLYDGSLYNTSNAVYREMLSSGRFYSLGPDSLMKRIQKYYQLLDREERYVIEWNEEANIAWKECKYGFNDLVDDYRLYGRDALKDHPWYLDRESREFIDLKSALLRSHRSTERNRRHAYTMIQHSDTLMQALQHQIQAHR
ncbi:MAG: DUF6090 family protein [Flavobacteriales bacterium]